MLRWALWRLMGVVPVLFVLVILAFGLLAEAPDHETLAQAGGLGGAEEPPSRRRERLAQWRHTQGYDVPVFYFSIGSQSLPDSLLQISDPQVRRAVRILSLHTGAGAYVWRFHKSLMALEDSIFFRRFQKPDGSISEVPPDLMVQDLAHATHPQKVDSLLNVLSKENWGSTQVFETVQKAWKQVRDNSQPWRRWVPRIAWHPDCRFHRWIWGTERQPGLLKGHLGFSLRDGRPVVGIITSRWIFTLAMSLLSLAVAFFLALPAGVATAWAPTAWQKIILTGIYALYATPSFVMGSLLILWFAGGYLSWFPSYGLSFGNEGLSAPAALQQALAHLVLPAFCWTYGGFSYFFLHARQSALQSLNAPWFLACRARGLPYARIVRRYIIPQALLPMVALLPQVFPALMGGSVILEVLFSLPGMGELTYHSVLSGDYPVLLGVLLLGASVTVFFSWLSDVCMRFLDARIRLSKE
ncbi:MAG: ABC transporter permease [Flavobacteriales bacterium]|nr:ABC transporter permease [Flavobacteriales bacterium]MDW8432282.1 ABC transporter permease [Flavobacteriales bacterium]